MSLLARTGTYNNGEVADGPTLRGDLDQLYNILNSTSVDKNGMTRFNGADPTFIFDQLGGGYVCDFRTNGTSRVRINNSGQVESTLSTGTSPLSVTSTTVNTNLNADLLDGQHATFFAADPGGNGLVARTGSLTAAARTITGPAAGISVSNGDGTGGNPTLALANDLAALEGLGSTGLAARTGS